MLHNARVTALTIFELLRESLQVGGLKLPPRLGLIGLASKLYDVEKILISFYAICY